MEASNLKLLEHHLQLVEAILSSEHIPKELRYFLSQLGSFFNLDRQCAFPTRRRLSERSGYSKSYISELVRRCKEAGYITVSPQYYKSEGDKAARQIANLYQFNLEKFGFYCNKIEREVKNLARKVGKKEKSSKPKWLIDKEAKDAQVTAAYAFIEQENAAFDERTKQYGERKLVDVQALLREARQKAHKT
ncbi:TPA: hypothetical protein VGS73_003576 [Vibrio cholerae]|uniref:MarR family transcriptional regulator n=1 Tax=Vibrio cholerae TaxID=666 RepID=UPI001F2E1383|nr:helix-turn-helix domain-containing protein [Vibrio cholerae]UIP05454.1 MarR family transcriptional regulator [Vibrio cholerae]HEQ3434848.1 hypothetical protein [Vibrio cholerae]HEQ3495728.1 hypothetical protein [Vibrio cholerae]HEQ3507482.1 hypothetical protein [Vibrio cholerae]HEQ3572014.1 hypothetical protein [Vibrio cholerae]